jgi:hypothetical protein
MPHDTPAAIAATQAQDDKLNQRDQLIYTPDSAPQLAPPYKVYIFNLMPMEWKVEKGSAGTFTIKGCEFGEPYSDPLVLPSVVQDSYFVESEMKTHSVSGEFMAQDIVHPTIGANWSFGQNLDDLGVFWTKNNPPHEAEIQRVRQRMEVTGRKLLTMATSIETSGRLDDITPLMRIFATYFGEDRSWNRIYKKLSSCPGCGEPVKEGIIKHSCGYIFDIDRALLAGMINPEQHKTIMEVRRGEHDATTERKGGGKGDRARTAK